MSLNICLENGNAESESGGGASGERLETQCSASGSSLLIFSIMTLENARGKRFYFADARKRRSRVN